MFSLGFKVCSLVSRLLGGSLSPGPGCPHHRRHCRTGNIQTEKSKGMIERGKRRRRETVIFLHDLDVFMSTLLQNCLCVCVLSQVSALYFTSAHISLFERRGLRTDSDSADIILWDELIKGKHCSCYTVTHRAHVPAWVRKGRQYKLTNTHTETQTQSYIFMCRHKTKTLIRRHRNILIVALTPRCAVSTSLVTPSMFPIVCK